MVQFNGGTTFLVKGKITALLISAVDARDIDENVNQLAANLVIFHFNCTLIGGDVDLGNHIEEKGLVDLGRTHKLVQELNNKLRLG